MPTDIAKLLPTIIRYKNLSTTLGEDGIFIDLSDSPEPFFDIVLNSIEPYLVDDAGYIMSFGGMSMQFHRKNLGLLIGGYYVPTGNLQNVSKTLSLSSHSKKKNPVMIFKNIQE